MSDTISENTRTRDIPTYTRGQIMAALDLAVLQPDARLEDVTNAARVVEDLGAASICVASYNVAVAKQITPRVCSVVGFPHGNTSPQVKLEEARGALEDGAVELDVVINYGRFLEGRIAVVAQGTRPHRPVGPPQKRPLSKRSSKRRTTSRTRSSRRAASVWTAAWTL